MNGEVWPSLAGGASLLHAIVTIPAVPVKRPAAVFGQRCRRVCRRVKRTSLAALEGTLAASQSEEGQRAASEAERASDEARQLAEGRCKHRRIQVG